MTEARLQEHEEMFNTPGCLPGRHRGMELCAEVRRLQAENADLERSLKALRQDFGQLQCRETRLQAENAEIRTHNTHMQDMLAGRRP